MKGKNSAFVIFNVIREFLFCLLELIALQIVYEVVDIFRSAFAYNTGAISD